MLKNKKYLMAKLKTQLPPLAFGNRRSRVDLDLYEMQQTVNQMTDWVSEFDSLDKDSPFQHRTSTFYGDQLRLIAVSSTPTVMKVKDPSCTIALPISGSYQTWVNGKNYRFSCEQGAMYFPSGKRYTEGGDKSTLLISLNERSIVETVKSMLGIRSILNMDLDVSRTLSLKVGKVDFQKIIRNLCLLIDQCDGDPALLKNMALEDSIYRVCAMMIKPELFLSTDDVAFKKTPESPIDGLCEWIVANLDKAITLSHLERVSGLSARLLQYAFARKYGCTPMQWVREQRLGFAHKMLLNADELTKISSVAAMCGFANFSDFAKRYAERFGQLPSVTLKISLNRL